MTISRFSKTLALGVAGSALLFCAQAQAVPNPATITGVVKNAAGQPVAGAFVKLKNTDGRLTFMVVSQTGGAYTAGDLPAGQYTVQGIGGGFTSAVSAPVSVEQNGKASMDLALATKQGPMLPPAWPGRVPQDQFDKAPTRASALADGPAKALTTEKCTVCHDVQRIITKRSDVADWTFTIKRMRTNMLAASLPDISDQDAATITKYLSTAYQPLKGTDENSRLPRTLATGLGTKYRVVTFNLPRQYSEPHDIAVDPSGVAWAAERAGALIRFDPKNLEFTERPIPAGPAPADRQRLGNPQIDAKGMLWTADGPNGRWLSYDTVNRQYKSYPWTEKGHGGAGGNTFAIHPNGTIWGTGMGKEVRMLNPATLEWKFYEAPSAKATGENPGAYGMAIAGDGSVWWAEDDADAMARVDPTTGKVEEFKIPDLGGHALPRRMNSDANGDLWVGLWQAGKLLKIDHKTKKMTVFTPKTPALGMYSVVADKKNGYIWVSAQQVDKIFRFDPKTSEFVEFPLSYAEQDPRRIDLDPTNPNRIFFSGNTADRIGFLEVLP